MLPVVTRASYNGLLTLVSSGLSGIGFNLCMFAVTKILLGRVVRLGASVGRSLKKKWVDGRFMVTDC